MGQIKNIKLHIVADIKTTENKQPHNLRVWCVRAYQDVVEPSSTSSVTAGCTTTTSQTHDRRRQGEGRCHQDGRGCAALSREGTTMGCNSRLLGRLGRACLLVLVRLESCYIQDPFLRKQTRSQATEVNGAWICHG